MRSIRRSLLLALIATPLLPQAAPHWVAPTEIARIVLFHGDAMWGGRNIWIDEQGQLHVQDLNRGMQYVGRSTLSQQQHTELVELVARQDFRRATSPPSTHTEALWITIHVALKSGATYNRSVKNSTSDPAFNKVVGAVMAAANALTPAPLNEAPYDRNWRPPGFPSELRAE